MDAQQLWQTVLGQLQVQLARPTFETWVKNTRAISYEDGVLVVGVHTAYAKDWLENRLYASVQRTASDIAHRTVTLRFIVQRNSHGEAADDLDLLEGPAVAPAVTPAEDVVGDRGGARLNPRYTFDTFIVGQSNRLAHAGCMAVAERPGTAYNPLFVYGGVGLGKTHLLHAIGNCVIDQGKRVLYVSAETFANELINAIRNRTTDDFRAKYRTIDVLLLDDVQFLINKERTQEEFFHTFNDLYHEDRQIVLSSDRPPKAFVGLEERLRSRFEWGLSADVQLPDLETRMAILDAKAAGMSIHLPGEVLEFVAQQVQSNIRELEGALTRVLALARMMDFPLTVQTAERALGDAMRPPAEVTIDDILAEVSAYFGLRVDDLVGPRRNREVAQARQVAMYMARELTALSLPQIGNALAAEITPPCVWL
jgi:chromosomal replication initiator protein